MALIDSKWERLLEKSQTRNFPDAILFDILSRLPVKSIIRFKSVCKEWYTLFGESLFIEAHLNQSIDVSDGCYLAQQSNYYNEETGNCEDRFSLRSVESFEEMCELRFESNPFSDYDLIAAAGGIVCLVDHFVGQRYIFYWYLWNPATRELRNLPEFLGQGGEYCLGFGFDPKHNDYKAVAISYLKDSCEVYLYSLRMDSWRAVEANLSDKIWPETGGVYVNDRMHWLWRDPFCEWRIVAFDFTEEKIIEMDAPEFDKDVPEFEMDLPEFDRNNYAILHESPASLGKSLFLCNSTIPEDGFQVWFMKEYEDSKSWIKLCCLPSRSIYASCMRPLVYLDNGKIIMVSYGKLILYDPKNHVYRKLDVDGIYCGVVKYNESLMSVKGGGSISNLNKCASISNSCSSTISLDP